MAILSSCIWSRWILTLLDAEAGGPLLQGDVFVVVGVALLEEASGAMLHGNERSAQGGELCVGQVPVVPYRQEKERLIMGTLLQQQ